MQNRINLLAPSTTQKVKSAPEGPNPGLVALCVICVVVLIGAYGVIFGLNKTTETKIASVRNEITSLRDVSGQMKEKESLISEKAKTTNNIKKLVSEKPILSKYLDELDRIMPTTLNLTYLQVKHSPFEAVFKGTSAAHLYVAQFGRNVQESVYFENGIVSSSQRLVKDNLIEYVITVTPEKKGGDN